MITSCTILNHSTNMRVVILSYWLRWKKLITNIAISWSKHKIHDYTFVATNIFNSLFPIRNISFLSKSFHNLKSIFTFIVMGSPSKWVTFRFFLLWNSTREKNAATLNQFAVYNWTSMSVLKSKVNWLWFALNFNLFSLSSKIFPFTIKHVLRLWFIKLFSI